MFRIRSIWIILLLVSLGTQATDYCQMYKCGSQHIRCNNTGEFALECQEPAVVDLEPLIPLILSLHNQRRNQVAGGKTNLRPAVRMATMQWDDELAALAVLNVKTCLMKHDHCRATEKFKYAGQNIGGMSYTGKQSRYSNSRAVKGRIGKWLSESTNCTMELIRSVTSGHAAKNVDHFTVMVTDRNTHVGCGAIREKINGRHVFFIACNYASTNLITKEVYEDGDEPASKCTTGTNPVYVNLCSIDEVYKLH